MTVEQTLDKDFQDNNTQAPEGQPDNNTQPVEDEDKIRLRNEFTQARQREIELATQLAERDKKTILSLDSDTQKKVVKRLYGLSNLEEVKLIHWENFYEEREGSESEEEDRLSKLEKELKLTKYNQSKKEIDNAIWKVKEQNAIYFEDNSFEDKLKDELKYISTELDTNERVRRAFSILKSSWVNENSAAYKELKDRGSYQKADITINNKEEEDSVKTEISSIFKRNIRK